ncbi:MAG: hypothetical protein KBB37_00300 [Bacteroidia bacterium]|nr:hypothetical protein [Bacteroidia bacterium]MBP7259699.1 hypothetical protein [Bacteroidia bacterium]MBP9179396.1 hypothetical protein [Bacteroidia bacterium]MBP9723350.1 hypothetical protein [Bacteroidia bacterium]
MDGQNCWEPTGTHFGPCEITALNTKISFNQYRDAKSFSQMAKDTDLFALAEEETKDYLQQLPNEQ